jgi:hypothetical protein
MNKQIKLREEGLKGMKVKEKKESQVFSTSPATTINRSAVFMVAAHMP